MEAKIQKVEGVFQRPGWARGVEDLLWYFQSSGAAQGLHSNFPAVVQRIVLGRGAGRASYEFEEHSLDAARRARCIERVLAALDATTRSSLAKAFGADDEQLQTALSPQTARRLRRAVQTYLEMRRRLGVRW